MAWAYVGVSAVASASSGNITLTEPASVAEGDLLVCIISYRSNAAFTSPGAPWVSVTSQNTGNTTANSTGSISSGHLFYCIRGASAPGLVFTRTAGDIALGRIVAYRGNTRNANVLVTQTSTTLAAAATAVSVTGLTTANARDLIVFGFCGARNGSASAFDAATNPATDSGTASNETGAPAEGDWQERCDSGTTTGADTTLAIADALRATAGATGNLTCTASSSARHTVVAAAFMEGEELTATGVASGNPSVGTPAITQAHALTATGVATGSPSVGAAALGQIHGLTATGIASAAPSVGAPELSEVVALGASNIATAAPSAGTPAITQTHVLTTTGIATAAPFVGSPALGQVHVLTATGIAAGSPLVGSPELSVTGQSEAPVQQPSGGWATLASVKGPPKYEDEPEKPKRRRKRKRIGPIDPSVIETDAGQVQTGIIAVKPAANELANYQRMKREASDARAARYRRMALADDEWMMMN